MPKPQTALERARHGAQEPRKKTSHDIAKAEKATWADARTDINRLGARIKRLAVLIPISLSRLTPERS